MVDDEFNERVKRKFAELERKHGRVPTIAELANSLGVDSRFLERKLRKAIATLGTEEHTEGTSAFQSTLSELLSGDLLFQGMPGYMDLSMLFEQAKKDKRGYSKLSWRVDKNEYQLRLSVDSKGSFWMLFGPRGKVFARITDNILDICELFQALAKNEIVDKTLITHMNGEPVPFEPEELPYQEPIPQEELPPNVFSFRKPYQHSED